MSHVLTLYIQNKQRFLQNINQQLSEPMHSRSFTMLYKSDLQIGRVHSKIRFLIETPNYSID